MRYAETWREARVAAIRDLTPTIRAFDLVPEGEQPRVFPLGGHLDVVVQTGQGAETRSYSILGADGYYSIAVKRDRDGRGGSQYMWSLAPGARLSVSDVRSNFPLDYGYQSYLLIAGGIGITPLYGSALALAARGARFALHYCVREPNELAFAGELRAALGDRLVTHVSAAKERLDLKAVLAAATPNTLVMMCGPLRMLTEGRRIWKELGRPAADLRFETFGSSGAQAPRAFRIHLPQLGRDIVVPENQSMLDALEAAGVGVISDCRRGECGVCALKIVAVDGSVDHRDVFFSEQQKRDNGKICVCVSRATGTITLDPLFRPDAPRS